MDNKSEMIRETQFSRVLQDAQKSITSFYPTENEFTYIIPIIPVPFTIRLKESLRKIIPKPIFKGLRFLYRFVKHHIK